MVIRSGWSLIVFLFSFPLLVSFALMGCRTTYDAPKRPETGKKVDPLDEQTGRVITPAPDGDKEDDKFDREAPIGVGSSRVSVKPSIKTTVDTAAYRPTCSPNGLLSEGEFDLKYQQLDPDKGEMQLVSGEGFPCKQDLNTDLDDWLPTCKAVCPGATMEKGWGTCKGIKKYECRVAI